MNPQVQGMVGQVLAGYRLEKVLGSGGLGVVFLARSPDGQPVALKMLRRLTERSRKRFDRELAIGLKLDHPNVVRTLDGGEISGNPYLVLEYLEGRSLGAILEEEGTLSVARTLDLAQQILAGVDALHSRKIIHRDLKPDNLQILPDGTLKLLDLGLIHVEEETKLTATGTVMGTILFMAPEQLAGKKACPGVDLFSVALMLFQCLQGGSPYFEGPRPDIPVYYNLVMAGKLRCWNPAYQGGNVDGFFARALARDPALRYPDGAAMVAALRRSLEADGLLPPRERGGHQESSPAVTLPEVAPLELSGDALLKPPGSSSASSPGPLLRGLPKAPFLVLLGLVLFFLGYQAQEFLPEDSPEILSVTPLALSDRHRLLAVRTRSSCQISALGAPPGLRLKEGCLHLLPLPVGADGVRLVDENERLLQARSLPEESFLPVVWSLHERDRGSRFEIPGTSLQPVTLTAENRREFWPDLQPLSDAEGLLEELVEAVAELDLRGFLEKAQLQGWGPDRLVQEIRRVRLHHLYESTKHLLKGRLENLGNLNEEDFPFLTAAHDLSLMGEWLRRNGVPAPFSPRSDGLTARLGEVLYYEPEDRPSPAPGRLVLARHRDHFLIEVPGLTSLDPLSVVWFVPREPIHLSLPPGDRDPVVEVFVTQADEFDKEAFGMISVAGWGPLYFFDTPERVTHIGWRDQYPKVASDDKMRRVFRVRLPRKMLSGETPIEFQFRLWETPTTRAYSRVVCQAVGLARD